MFKSMKRLFLAFFFVVLGIFAFACKEQELNKEVCKDYCEPGKSCESCPAAETCNEANAESCKEFCEGSESCPAVETCEPCEECPPPVTCPQCEKCKYVAPTKFIIFDDDVKVGTTSVNELDEVSPKGAYTGVYWESSDESILTVDQEGVMTGVRPGIVEVTATSVLNPEATYTVTIKVVDELSGYDLVARELDAIIAQLPAYAGASFDFPGLWNLNGDVEVKYYDNENNLVTGFVYPEGLAEDKQLSYTVVVTSGASEVQSSFKVWATPNVDDNCYVRLEQAAQAASILLKAYTSNVEKVKTDIALPEYIYGVEMNWDTTNPAVIDDDGKYLRPLDDRSLTLSTTEKYGASSKNCNYSLVAAGYSKEEKIEYILNEGSLAFLNGGKFNTSLVLPAYDDKFDAKLTYVSKNAEIYGNDGALVAAPAAETEVAFDVTIDYSMSKNYGFTETVEVKFFAEPANAASAAAEAWLKASEFKTVYHFPYGGEKGNVLDVPVAGEGYTVEWDVKGAKVQLNSYYVDEPTFADAFALTAEGKPQIIVQPLRYKEVQIKGTFTAGEETAEVVLVLNIGISADSSVVYTGVWRSVAQGDTELSVAQGAYDIVDNASHYDMPIGYTNSHYGSGLFSGWVITGEPYGEEGKKVTYETFFSELMYWEIQDDGAGIKKAHLDTLTSGDGGNWGYMVYNSSSKDVYIEIGTYAADGQYYQAETVTDANYEDLGLTKGEDGLFYDGETAVTEYARPIDAAVGSRTGLAMDGYAYGFIADATGKIIYGGGDDRLQTGIPYNKVAVGSTDLMIADSAKGANVIAVKIPAGGYAVSWKYQFYGVGVASTLFGLCQPGEQLTIKHYEVAPLNGSYATKAMNYLATAKTATTASALRSAVNNARTYYNGLADLVKADVFDAADLEAEEARYAKMFDEQIAELLAQDPAEGFSTDEKFIETLSAYNNQYENDTAELKALYTKGADLVACFNKYAALDLTITYDYDGGYAKGLYADTDFDVVIGKFLGELYDFMVEKGAWTDEGEVKPDKATFCSVAYWSDNYAKYADTELGNYLFTPNVDVEGTDEITYDDYKEINESYNKFFNSEVGHKWIDLMNYVNEATQYANGAGQDAWGRKGQPSEAMVYLQKQSNYSASLYKDMTTVPITNSGTLLGAYRFAQYIIGGLNANYKNRIPNKIYSAIFDRQTTQERYSTQVYHCTDAKVALIEAAYKEGFEFDGWYFVNEDGTLGDKAEVTGSLFKNVTVKAKWLSALEGKVAEAAGKEVTAVYYPVDEKNGGQYRADLGVAGTLSSQEKAVGIGKYVVIVGDKAFFLPKFALIELGANATADLTISEKADLEPWGVDESQDSTGIIYDAATDTAKKQNSYGHGALYQNVSEYKITIADITKTYGRNLGGAAYGYNRYLFHKDAETGKWTAKLIGAAAGTSCTLEPGDFLWCPMTAERFNVNLTDCDGTSGKVGVLSDGCEIDIIDISGFTPAPAKAWYTVKFIADDKEVAVFYPEDGDTIVAPTAPAKDGFKVLGWATTAEATEAGEVATTPEADATYYAVYEELPAALAVTVDPSTDGSVTNTYATLALAISAVAAEGTVTVLPGTYKEDITIEKSLTIVGPNAGKPGTSEFRTAEAVLAGHIVVKADNVTIEGIKISGTSASDTVVPVALGSTKNFKFINNVIDGAWGTPDTAVYGNNRRPMIANLAGTTVEGVVIDHNLFDFNTIVSSTGGTYLRMAFAFDGGTTKDITFTNNECSPAAANGYYIYAPTAGTMKDSGNTCAAGTINGDMVKTKIDLTVDATLAEETATSFKTIAAAIAAAQEGATITVAAGTYAEELNITKAVKLVGPNAAVHGKSSERLEEAEITGKITFGADFIELIGFKLTDGAAVIVSGDNCKISNNYIAPSTLQACNGNNRKACIVDGASLNDRKYVSGLVVENNYIKNLGTSWGYTNNYMSFSWIADIAIRNNYITNEATTAGTSGEGIMVYYAGGIFRIEGNEFRYATTNWLVEVGYYQTDCEEFSIIDNIFAGRDSLCTCTVGVLNLTARTNLSIIGNDFLNVDPSTITLGSKSSADAKCTVMFNYYDNQKEYKFPYATENTTCNYNFYEGKIASSNAFGSPTADGYTFTSYEALKTAYTAYKADGTLPVA